MDGSFDSLKNMVRGANQCTHALDLEAQAMKAIAEDEDLAYAAMAIKNNPSSASMYLHLDTKRAHSLYILRQMEKIKGEN
jgi:hypothetical protein